MSKASEGPYRRCAVVAVLAVAVFGTSAASQAESLADATTSPAARDDALNSIPFDKLKDEMQGRLSQVVTQPSIYRRLPIESIEADPDMYVFLVRHPDVIVNIWRLMGATNVSINRTGQYSVHAMDGMGTTTDVELVYGTPGLHVLYAEGTYEGPVLRRKIHGRCVLVLKSDYMRKPDGRVTIRNTLDVFVQFQNVGAALVARVLQNLVGQSADQNFSETMRFVGRLSEVSERNGPGVERLAERLTLVQPDIRRRFAEVARTVYHRGIMREAASSALEPPASNLQPASAVNE